MTEVPLGTSTSQEASMNRDPIRRNRNAKPIALALWMLLGSAAVLAQVPVDEYGNPVAAIDDGSAIETGAVIAEGDNLGYDTIILGTAELQELVGPVALYPDDLLAIVLPASTYPLEIVQAARFLEKFAIDSTLEPDASWDESVIALLNYPDVVRMLDEDIDWTWQLGEAVVNQQDDVVAAVESFRDRAYAAGNLQSDEHQEVKNSEGIIEIVPIEDDVIYVPYYEPERVVEYQPTSVYHYYPRANPVYYYPYPVGHAFNSGFFWGVTSAYRIGWLSDSLHVRHHSYWGHPYFGHSYYGHYYRRPSINVYNSSYGNYRSRYANNYRRDGDHWRPRRHSGARPGDRNKRDHRNRESKRGGDRERTYTNNSSNDRHRNNKDRPVYADGPGRRDSSAKSGNRPANRDGHSNRSDDSLRANNGNQRSDRKRNSKANGRSGDSSISFREREQKDVVANNRETYRNSSKNNRARDQRSGDSKRENRARTQNVNTVSVAHNNNASRSNNRQASERNTTATRTRGSARNARATQATANSNRGQQQSRKQNTRVAKNEPRTSRKQDSGNTKSERRSSSGSRERKSENRGGSRNNERKSQRR
jgi:hypothetical protein